MSVIKIIFPWIDDHSPSASIPRFNRPPPSPPPPPKIYCNNCDAYKCKECQDLYNAQKQKYLNNLENDGCYTLQDYEKD